MIGTIAIDPGITGGLVYLDDSNCFPYEMPVVKHGKITEIDFDGVRSILKNLGESTSEILLERAMPMAMGAKHAFNYGRGFAAVEIAVKLSGIPVTYVEPSKWCKEMHAGISADLKPKAKSLIACERLFPSVFPVIQRNRNGKAHEGIVDALLIAAYGRRKKI